MKTAIPLTAVLLMAPSFAPRRKGRPEAEDSGNFDLAVNLVATGRRLDYIARAERAFLQLISLFSASKQNSASSVFH